VAGRGHAGRWAAAALAIFVAAQGTDHTLALQRRWTRESFYRPQRNVLRAVVTAAPALEPGTLVVLLAATDVFRLDLGFRHAIRYLYGGQAIGHAPGADPFLYATRFEPEGVVVEPWPVIRDAWGEPVQRYRYEQVVVFSAEGGGASLQTAWPATLPPLPAGARYEPRLRIRERTGPPPALR
jgi:hypothetical protein